MRNNMTLNCLHWFRTKNKLKSHKKVRENKDFCDLTMLCEKMLLEFGKHVKSIKASFLIDAGLEC